MIAINVGTRLGFSRIVQSVQEMPNSMKSGFVPEEEQQSMGQETIHPIALDPLTWHIAIVVGTATLAFAVAKGLKVFWGVSIPIFCMALLLGAIIQKFFNLIKLGRYIDRHVIHRVGSLVTDFLIGFGIASISIEIVANFALPLIILFCFGTLFTLAFLWFVGPRICRNFWFERTMTVFGWSFGTVATSIMLLRVIDPDLKSPVLEDFSISYFAIAFAEIAIVSLLPQLIVSGYILEPSLVLVGVFFICLLLSRYIVGWSKFNLVAVRPGEKAVIESTGATNSRS
jgi:ESS family glutamate:Na+ symporter